MDDLIDLSATDSIAILESICRANVARVVRLPSGAMALVSPADDLKTLSDALQNPSLRATLKQSTTEFAGGMVEPFDP